MPSIAIISAWKYDQIANIGEKRIQREQQSIKIKYRSFYQTENFHLNFVQKILNKKMNNWSEFNQNSQSNMLLFFTKIPISGSPLCYNSNYQSGVFFCFVLF